jgi:hypothetical protein
MEVLTMLGPFVGEGMMNTLLTLLNAGTSIYEVGKLVHNWLKGTFHKEVKNKIEERLNNVTNIQKHKRIKQLEKMRAVPEKELKEKELNISSLRKVLMDLQKEKNININNDMEKDKKNKKDEQIINSLSRTENSFRDNNNNDIQNLSLNAEGTTVIKPSPLNELRMKLFGHNYNNKISDLQKIHNKNAHKVGVLNPRLITLTGRLDTGDLQKNNFTRYQKPAKRF